MVFRVYKAGDLSDDREREQMNRLIRYLKRDLSLRNEDCTIIIEPFIPVTLLSGEFYHNKPDALLLKDNMFILIEMKRFKGDILADCSRGGMWKTKEGKELHKEGRNPFNQADGHRISLVTHLEKNFAADLTTPSWARKYPYSVREWVTNHVCSWVVTEEASRPELIGIDQERVYFFKVLSLDKLSQTLPIFRTESLLTPTGLKRLFDSLGAKVVHSNEWYRGPFVENPQVAGLEPRITNWIESENYDDIIKAMKYIKDLQSVERILLIPNPQPFMLSHQIANILYSGLKISPDTQQSKANLNLCDLWEKVPSDYKKIRAQRGESANN